ncbi:hypothetical protein T492DRAFT_898059 [Pavlovales sp. CCMP2436]|nr:hypothetical protein T492DRAFT_898059 [Pavlovales sp. CCMP2436]
MVQDDARALLSQRPTARTDDEGAAGSEGARDSALNEGAAGSEGARDSALNEGAAGSEGARDSALNEGTAGSMGKCAAGSSDPSAAAGEQSVLGMIAPHLPAELVNQLRSQLSTEAWSRRTSLPRSEP